MFAAHRALARHALQPRAALPLGTLPSRGMHSWMSKERWEKNLAEMRESVARGIMARELLDVYIHKTKRTARYAPLISEFAPNRQPATDESLKHLRAVGVLARHPVITADNGPIDTRQYDLYKLHAVENAPESFQDFFARHSLMKKSKSGNDKASEASPEQAKPQFKWTPAPRVTEADEKNDVRSLNRNLQNYMYLVLKTVKTGTWELPSAVPGKNVNISLREAATYACQLAASDDMITFFSQSAPLGAFKDPSTNITDFFYFGRYMSGEVNLDIDTYSDYAWVSRLELPDYIAPDRCQQLLRFLPPTLPITEEDLAIPDFSPIPDYPEYHRYSSNL